jgi:hypothetical protein
VFFISFDTPRQGVYERKPAGFLSSRGFAALLIFPLSGFI